MCVWKFFTWGPNILYTGIITVSFLETGDLFEWPEVQTLLNGISGPKKRLLDRVSDINTFTTKNILFQ